MAPKTLRIFVLADTHDHLPDNLAALAEGTDEIWHLGDVCSPSLFLNLENVGPPVTLVRGNCDSNFEWPLVVDLKRNGVRFRLAHIPPSRLPENVDVVLHAHTHVPRNEREGGVLFLNPGSVTHPKDGARRSVAMLEIAADGKIAWHLTMLR
jgi:putative phosphoesterase